MFGSKDNYILATPSAITRRLRKKKRVNLIAIGLLGGAIVFVANQWKPSPDTEPGTVPGNSGDIVSANVTSQVSSTDAEQPRLQIDKAFLREALGRHIKVGKFPAQLVHEQQDLFINYTLDEDLQNWATERLKRYNPDYGVFVAIAPDTGKVLAMASSRRDEKQSSTLALNATYPAASTFKVITAAAAIEEGIATPATVYAFNGKSTSLYKSQVFKVKQNKWTRRMSFKTAFAKSVNPIFGRLGANELGDKKLIEYAERFGFNAQFISDFEFDNGSIKIEPGNQWQAAESASGYTRRNTLSPMHGAALAASIVNGGKLIPPSIVESVTSAKNQVLYTSGDTTMIDVLSAESARSMQQLMRATITEGTGRRSFRKFTSKKYPGVVTGGKSGHLSGQSPKGSYDWFIGYGERNSKKIAYAMLCINKEKWYVKSSVFAREALEYYFKKDTTKMTKQARLNGQAETS
jgi:peptidoglycan glycosyltransferase